ncbi:hypothetical protein GCM10012320_24380 [Sinomonas cellulolyticus]|nr:hypothetical protein GCM10012320_24380 [Sinomonas sp. KCTC 49339]
MEGQPLCFGSRVSGTVLTVDAGAPRSDLHLGHPATREGCRPISQSFASELLISGASLGREGLEAPSVLRHVTGTQETLRLDR